MERTTAQHRAGGPAHVKGLLAVVCMTTLLVLAGCTAPSERSDPPVTGPPTDDPEVTPSDGRDEGPARDEDDAGDEPAGIEPGRGVDLDCTAQADCLRFVADASEWHIQRTDCLGGSDCAPQGAELLLLTVVVENGGTTPLSLNPADFQLFTSSTVHDLAPATYSTGDPLDDTLWPSDRATGQLAYEVDRGATAQRLCWEGYSSEALETVRICHDLSGSSAE